MAESKHLHCPQCSSEDIISRGKRYALYPVGCVAILSVPFAWLHRESTPVDFECRACGRCFFQRTTPAKIAYGALWMTTVLGVCYLLKTCHY
jgi:predicted RNA-binding Zn-ribbon protein involved in translation (DUF1610 family)